MPGVAPHPGVWGRGREPSLGSGGRQGSGCCVENCRREQIAHTHTHTHSEDSSELGCRVTGRPGPGWWPESGSPQVRVPPQQPAEQCRPAPRRLPRLRGRRHPQSLQQPAQLRAAQSAALTGAAPPAGAPPSPSQPTFPSSLGPIPLSPGEPSASLESQQPELCLF